MLKLLNFSCSRCLFPGDHSDHFLVNINNKFGNRKFWAEGYYVSTVGLDEATIERCIREQERADIAIDRLSVKEYEDPFDRGPKRK